MKARLENTIVKLYGSLPTYYKINNVPHNLRNLSVETQEAEGFYSVNTPTITVYQRLEALIPSDFNGTEWVQRVYNFTAQEIIDYDETQVENAIAQALDIREQDGIALFKRLRNLVNRKHSDAVISNAQYKGIRNTLQPALQPLRYGDWDIAQDNIDDIAPPSGQLLALYTFIKDKIDTYVLENY
jgi:hypothetical protein